MVSKMSPVPQVGFISWLFTNVHLYSCTCSTVDPVTNDLASARQKKSLVTESRWSQE